MTDFLVDSTNDSFPLSPTENLVAFSRKTQPVNKNRIFESHHIEKLLLDISAHICPKRLTKELQYVFPNCDLTNVIAIPTMQFAKSELVNIGDEIEVEKDRLLERVRHL